MEDNKIDINSLIGFFLIGFIFIGWLWLNPPPPGQENVNSEITSTINVKTESDNEELADVLSQSTVAKNENENINSLTSTKSVDDKKIKFETSKFLIEFSAIGGQISSLKLKEHLNYLGNYVSLVNANNSTLDLDFTTNTGKLFNTKNQFFVPTLTENGSEKIVQMKLTVSDDVFLKYTYTFNDDDYLINLDVKSNGFKNILDTSKDYNLVWELDAIRNSKSIDYENRYSYLTYYHDDDKIDYLAISGEDEDDEESVNWISYKQHFFSSVLIPQNIPFKSVSFKSENLVEDNSIDTLNLKKFTSK